MRNVHAVFFRKGFLQRAYVFLFSMFISLLAGLLTANSNNPISPVIGILTEKSEDVWAQEPENSKCKISTIFTSDVQQWEAEICRWSEEHSMDPNLIATIMQIESCGNNAAVSATGVRGLFQVTGANLDGGDPFDPNVSMAKGPGKVLKNEIGASGGDIRAAMAGYNGGGKAREYIAGKITRTEFYWFLRNHSSRLWRTDAKALAKINEVERYAQWANIYFEAKEGKTDTLNEWLSAGGYRMCASMNGGLALKLK